MNWFFNRKGTDKPARKPQEPKTPEGIYLNALGQVMLASLNLLENASIDLELMRARLADHCRDMNRQPMDPDEFMRQAGGLDIESQRRFALAVAGLDDGQTRLTFLRRVHSVSASHAFETLIDFARKTDLLSMELLIESPLRREEFLRHYIVHLGGTIEGETPADSQDRLNRLDYRTLLAEAQRAKLSAEERLAYLKELQEKQESKIGRRSKF